MRFISISFNNYRCFLNGTVYFSETANKSLNLIIGQNGAGKTEFLFAFYWVLYGFDFKDLIMKESTPYALNSGLYRELEVSQHNDERSCSVEIKFKSNENEFLLKKTQVFEKKNRKILVHTESEMRHYDENGAISPPIRDINKIEHTLFSILPPHVANGIFFDGEKMKKLSTIDQHSRVVEEVVNEITSVQIVEKSINILRNIQKEYSRNMRKLSGSAGDNALVRYSDEKVNAEQRYAENLEKFENNKRDKRDYNSELEKINSLLREVDHNKKLISEREKLEALVEQEKDHNNSLVNNDFIPELRNGYLLLLDKLFSDVESYVKKYDVPEGLTVDAVKSILNQESCICGETLEYERVENLKNLLDKLPPVNLNSQILLFASNLKTKAAETRKELRKKYKEVLESDNKINDYEDTISDLSKKILDGGSESIKDLEHKRDKATREVARIDVEQGYLEESINNVQKEILLLDEKIKNTKADSKVLKEYIDKLEFIGKSILAFENVKKYNKDKAINIINNLLYDNFQFISEDAERGFRAYVVSLDDEFKHKLIMYHEGKYEKELSNMKSSGAYDRELDKGIGSSLIEEQIKIKIREPNSTGQGKVLALSFVQSILDYSSSNKNDDEFMINKSYPIIIDAPFTEIFGRNLDNLSRRISDFSEQVILMLSEDSYQQVKNNIEDFIGSKYFLEKNNKDVPSSDIRKVI